MTHTGDINTILWSQIGTGVLVILITVVAVNISKIQHAKDRDKKRKLIMGTSLVGIAIIVLALYIFNYGDVVFTPL